MDNQNLIEIKRKILEIFKQDRQKPDSVFNESHFLDFLTFPPHKKNNIKNSFKGVRRYYRFMSKIELEFEICFTYSDLDRFYSVEQLSKKVEERIGKKRGNIMIIKQRTQEKRVYYAELFFIICAIAIYVFWGINLISILLFILCGVVIYWLIINRIRDTNHNKKLRAKILKEDPS